MIRDHKKRSPMGNMPIGEDHAKVRLTENQVRHLRHLVHEQQYTMAEARQQVAPEVTYITVVKAVTYENWRHVR